MSSNYAGGPFRTGNSDNPYGSDYYTADASGAQPDYYTPQPGQAHNASATSYQPAGYSAEWRDEDMPVFGASAAAPAQPEQDNRYYGFGIDDPQPGLAPAASAAPQRQYGAPLHAMHTAEALGPHGHIASTGNGDGGNRAVWLAGAGFLALVMAGGYFGYHLGQGDQVAGGPLPILGPPSEVAERIRPADAGGMTIPDRDLAIANGGNITDGPVTLRREQARQVAMPDPSNQAVIPSLPPAHSPFADLASPELIDQTGPQQSIGDFMQTLQETGETVLPDSDPAVVLPSASDDRVELLDDLLGGADFVSTASASDKKEFDADALVLPGYRSDGPLLDRLMATSLLGDNEDPAVDGDIVPLNSSDLAALASNPSSLGALSTDFQFAAADMWGQKKDIQVADLELFTGSGGRETAVVPQNAPQLIPDTDQLAVASVAQLGGFGGAITPITGQTEDLPDLVEQVDQEILRINDEIQTGSTGNAAQAEALAAARAAAASDAPPEDSPFGNTPIPHLATEPDLASSQAINPFGIQLAAMRSAAAAKDHWERLQKQHPELLGDMILSVQKVQLRSKGTFYRIQAGPVPNKITGLDVCQILKADGQACIVTERKPS